jgi:hypothetical protein
MAVQQDVRAAQALLGLLLALQAAFTLHVLAVWPYISQVLNLVELVCGCLEVAYLGVTIAVYNYMQGDLQLDDARVQVSRQQRRLLAWLPHPPAWLSVAHPSSA